jgi:branched-chain amino acid transport system ATP-binding protein
MSEFLLEVKGLCKNFGGVQALSDVACNIPRGQIKAIIGPNGAGKTTFFNCLTGVERPSRGEISFKGKDISRQPPYRIATAGMARTWQTIKLFQHMTALENVLVGLHCRSHCGIASSLLRLPRQRREETDLVGRAMCMLEFFGIADFAHHPVDELPFMQQRHVEFARALVSDPEVLLLDEPAAGLNSRETMMLSEVIRSIRTRDISILLVEHDMSMVMDISDSVLVLDHGTPIAEGTPTEIQNDEHVIAVYLGTEVE